MLNNRDVVDRVSSALLAGEFHEQAAELFERIGQDERALEGYRQGGAYARAVELARRAFPDEVIRLEEEWGDKLAEEKQLDAAINHYIEAGKTMKALAAAIGARQWKKAVQIVQVVDDDGSGELPKHFFRLGQHYESIKEYAMAQRFYMQVRTRFSKALKKKGEKSPQYLSSYTLLALWCVILTFINTVGKHAQPRYRDVQQGRHVGGGAPVSPALHGRRRGELFHDVRRR
jgi:hypothetical protein